MKKILFSFLFTTVTLTAFSQADEPKNIVFTKVEHEAKFPGGRDGWVTFLTDSLRADVASDEGAPVGIHTVKVQFIVDKEGNVGDVKAIEVPKTCPGCGTEAVRVLKTSPKWIPAIQNGRNVYYQAVQRISFEVVEQKSSKE